MDASGRLARSLAMAEGLRDDARGAAATTWRGDGCVVRGVRYSRETQPGDSLVGGFVPRGLVWPMGRGVVPVKAPRGDRKERAGLLALGRGGGWRHPGEGVRSCRGTDRARGGREEERGSRVARAVGGLRLPRSTLQLR